MTQLLNLIQQYGLLIVFANVFLEQIGLPLPAYPILLVMGALASQGQYSTAMLLLVAVTASLIADLFWYCSGRTYGRRVMAKLCRISLSPDSCVRQTESIYLRIGPPGLLFCKFIPGFASVSSALAGIVGTKSVTFIILDSLGAALWVGLAIFLGSLFSSAIDQLLDVLAQMGKWGSLFIALALAAFITAKWWQRYRFLKSLRMARISVDELSQMLRDGQRPAIIDVRPLHQQAEGKIPGAIALSVDSVETVILDGPDLDDEVILYCACPNEVTSARMAKLLMDKGYRRVRPLIGGIDAWINAGHKIEI